MNAREFSSHMSLCLANEIIIYPIYYARHKYKIVIERQGKRKIGDEIFESNARLDKSSKTLIPSVDQKIHQLYKQIADTIRKHKAEEFNNKK